MGKRKRGLFSRPGGAYGGGLMRMDRIVQGALLAVMWCMTGCGPKVEPPPRSMNPMPLPEFTLTALDGRVFTRADLQGKITVLHFCASWSPASAREIPQLEQLQEIFAEDRVQVIGIALEEKEGDMRAFAERTPVGYPILLAKESFHREVGGIDAIPTTFLVDDRGMIMNRHTGLVGRSVLEADVRRMLEERKTAEKVADR